MTPSAITGMGAAARRPVRSLTAGPGFEWTMVGLSAAVVVGAHVDAWAHGHQDLYKGPAPYSQMNDFGRFPPNSPNAKWYITFPPFTAMLMFPFVALGLSGFELTLMAMPLVRGRADDKPENPRGQIRNTRILLAVATVSMSA